MLPFEVPMEHEGIIYDTPENYYQAQKLPKDRIDLKKEISCLNPLKAKRALRNSKKYPTRDDWNKETKLKVMEDALRYKFAKGTVWHELLMQTGDEEIVEWNTWHDLFWGKDIETKQGDNHLGKILMRIRWEFIMDLEINK